MCKDFCLEVNLLGQGTYGESWPVLHSNNCVKVHEILLMLCSISNHK